MPSHDLSRQRPLPMKIILARHGRPDLQQRTWISPRDMKEWIASYDRADLVAEGAPAATAAAAETAAVVVASNLKRCVRSAENLSPNREFLVDPIFCEAELPHPDWNLPKLPSSIWGVLFRLAWFCGFSGNAEPLAQATARARAAADRLTVLARENGSVLLVGHGIMTMLIARQLLASGWTGPKHPANTYWQFSVYHATV